MQWQINFATSSVAFDLHVNYLRYNVFIIQNGADFAHRQPKNHDSLRLVKPCDRYPMEGEKLN